VKLSGSRTGIVSVVQSAPHYPTEPFDPSDAYPECAFDQQQPGNHVYGAVRDVLRHAGLDRERFGTDEWNPLRRWIGRGERVFALCNFVQHRRAAENPTGTPGVPGAAALEVIVNGSRSSIDELSDVLSRPFKAAIGWRGVIESQREIA